MRRSAIVVAALVTALLIGLGTPHAARAELTTPQDAVAFVAGFLDDFWSEALTTVGVDYSPLNGVDWYNSPAEPGPTWSACKMVDVDNAAYCQFDHHLYLDEQFLHWMLAEFGDGAVLFTISHEWAHHLQYLIYPESDRLDIEQRLSFELQADCLAGISMRGMQELGLLEEGDVTEGLLLATVLANASPPTLSGEVRTHGLAEERIDSFGAGYDDYSFAACGL